MLRPLRAFDIGAGIFKNSLKDILLRRAAIAQTDSHFPQIVEAIAPQGDSAVIDDPKTLDIVPLKRKSVAVHWKLMFMRPLFQTPDMARQHEILCRVAGLIDDESTMARCVLRLASISVRSMLRI